MLADFNQVWQTDSYSLLLIIVNGVSYHYQTMMAWVLMAYVSPVTHRSVGVHGIALLQYQY